MKRNVRAKGRAKSATVSVIRLIQQIDTRIRASDFAGAEQYCREWLSNTRSHDLWMGHFRLGIILQQSGRLAEAADAYRSSIVLAPGQPKPRINLAIVLELLNQIDEAITESEQALKCLDDQPRPDPAELRLALNGLAFRLFSSKRYREAEEIYFRSLELDSSQQPLHALMPGLRCLVLTELPPAVALAQPKIPAKIHQIFYDEKTRQAIDPLFIPLDNSHNPRSDWREYWPIRSFLLNNKLDNDVYLGFLSPRFYEKTELSGAEVCNFINVSQGQYDVIGFSPFFDNIAVFRDAFEQGDFHHPGLLDVAKRFFTHIGENGPLQKGGSHSRNTIYCNYFVARPPFWKKWLDLGEKLFDVCESNQTEFAHTLNASTTYRGQGVQIKVFVMERLVSYLLAKEEYSCLPYPPLRLPFSTGMIRNAQQLARLESYKLVGARTGEKKWQSMFLDERTNWLNSLRPLSPVGSAEGNPIIPRNFE